MDTAGKRVVGKGGKPRGFAAFGAIWASQIVSILASGMSGFALTIWMFERTKSATAMAAVQVFYILPFLVMSFFAGPMIDRYSRKLMMALSDICAAVGTAAVLAGFAGGFMDVWMIYASAALMGIGNAFQWPAFSAAITLMVPREQLGRVNGMMSLMEAGPAVLAPILAGILMPVLGIKGILVLDIATFFVALATLLAVEVPDPARSEAGRKAEGNLLVEAAWGFRYIFERPSLLGLQLLFLAGNLLAGIGMAVLAPMVLARSGGNSVALGGVQTAAALGGVAGGLVMSAWGGFKRRTTGVVTGWILSGIVGGLALGLGRSFWTWAVFSGLGSFAIPLVNGSNQAFWQSKVPADMQGRVFSARRLIAWIANPLTPLIGGPLADYLLEPAMRDPASGLARLLGPAFGTGPGAGMGVLISVTGLLAAVAAFVAWCQPAVRNAEDLLPDAENLARADGEEGLDLGEGRDGGLGAEAGGREGSGRVADPE